jgi:calcineurin-like phosphoesterase
MVWGAITYNQVSDLIIMQRDMKAKRQGYTAESYIQALQFGLPSIYTEEKIFQQDNAPVHTANKSKAFFKKEKLQS